MNWFNLNNLTKRLKVMPKTSAQLKRCAFALILIALRMIVCAQIVLAQNLTIPAGSTLNVNSGALNVTGSIYNDGTLALTTGTVSLTEGWYNNGTFTAGTGTVDLSGSSGTQTLDSGGVAVGQLFYNLTHSGASTVEVVDTGINIDGTFSNTAGTFLTDGFDMTVAGNWNNTGTFTHGNNTVTFDGTGQQVTGSTTFNNFTKVVAATDTLTFDNTGEQTIQGTLTMQGAAGQLLLLRSDSLGDQWDITLEPGGLQVLGYLDVQDSNADGPTSNGLLLVAGTTSADSLNNDNWAFGAATMTWQGDVSTDWENPANWDLGVKPGAGDNAIVPDVTGGGNVQPILTAATSITNLTLQADATIYLDQQDLSISDTIYNDGIVILTGNETVAIATPDTDSGTFKFIGDNDGAGEPFTLPDFGATDYYNVVIDDSSVNADDFITNSNIALAGTLTITNSSLDISANTNTLTLGGLSINGGALTATNGDINLNGDLTLSSGTLTAPAAGETFTISGDFTKSGGTFTHNSGTVILNGTAQTISASSTAFNNLTKSVVAADTLTFATGVLEANAPTVAGQLTLTGTSGNLLTIVSDVPGSQAYIRLLAGGTQTLNYLQIGDINAQPSGTGVLLVARNSTENPAGSTTNIAFGGVTLTWEGDVDTDWNTPANWDLGLVPVAGDNAIVPDTASDPVFASDVQVENLTVALNASVSMLEYDLTVDNEIYNDGTVSLQGVQSVSINTMDTDSGTFVFTGNGNGSVENLSIYDFGAADYFNLVINDPNATKDNFTTSSDLTVNGSLNVTSGPLDISAGTDTLTVEGVLTVDGGTLTADNGTIDVNDSVVISGGTLSAPTGSFTVANDWTHSAGTFTHNNGEVVLDTASTATVTGNTSFFDLTTSVAGKTIEFADGSTQTVNGTFDFGGTASNPLIMNVVSGGTDWNIDFPNGAQSVRRLNVSNSNALNNQVTCINCTDGGNNNANWVFRTLSIDIPENGKIVDDTPTIIGQAEPGDTVDIREGNGNTIVATTTADANGNYRVEVPVAMAVGANTLIPYVGVTFDVPTNVTISAAPTTAEVPSITSHADGDRVNGPLPTIEGQGLANAAIIVIASDTNGNLLQQTVASGTVDGSGNYSLTLSTPLPKGTNSLSVTVNGTASTIIDVLLTDPYGVVFDSISNQLIEGATVSIYRDGTNPPELAVPGVDLDAGDSNPVTTGSDGFYSYLTTNANYYIVVAYPDYTYPTILATLPAGRSIVTGSKGEVFTVSGAVNNMDHPMDSQKFLIRLEKDANKSEVIIGEVVTYTVRIENTSSNAVNSLMIVDTIPPGFKYLKDRVTLDGEKIADPTGNRPLTFTIGSIDAGTIKTLKYQLVVGSGVTQAEYTNKVVGKVDGLIVSNTATKIVKVVPDPLFDLGTAIGKVFFDKNANGIQDAPYFDQMEGVTVVEEPISNVRIVMEDGTVLRTDQEGKFSVPALAEGRHLFRIDERSLPEASVLTTDKVVIADVTPGLMVKVNFGVTLEEEKYTGVEDQFFIKKVNVLQDKGKPVARLNVDLYEDSLVFYDKKVVNDVRFRIFSNYSAFMESWRLDILDKDTQRVVFSQSGDKHDIFNTIYWNGKDFTGQYIRADRRYEYILHVEDKKGNFDQTKGLILPIRELDNQESLLKYNEQLQVLDDQFSTWVASMLGSNNLDIQTIGVDGETILIDSYSDEIKQITVLENGKLVTDVEVAYPKTYSASELLNSSRVKAQDKPLELILPNGDYEIVVVEGKKAYETDGSASKVLLTKEQRADLAFKQFEQDKGGALKTYTKSIQVGDSYLFFVAMGDAKAGYTFTKGDIEPVAEDDRYKGGYWAQGQMAYYLEGKIKGKYIITSSFDSDRQKKELFKNLDEDDYYPVYGDASTKDYKASDTQGPLYLLIEWDKSSAIWGNYAISFGDTEFAKWSRTLYGGKVDFESLGTTEYGEPRSKVVVFRAQANQKSAHNEFLATGGSLYYFKHQKVIQGSDKVSIEVRDKVTGLVISKREMVEGADYELDYDDGRMLFWRPVSSLVRDYSIISDELLAGNLVYITADYEYDVKDGFNESTAGARVSQAVTDNVLVGTTYVKDTQEETDYELRATDVTVHLGKLAKVIAEYAQTQSEAQNAFVSTDGGLTFDAISIASGSNGEAFGLKGDARLFNRLTVSSYYKWFDNNFSTSDTTAQQGKELIGFEAILDISDKSRLRLEHDIQTLIDDGNLESQLQLGAKRNVTTLLQYVQEIGKLKMTGEYKRTVVTETIDRFGAQEDTQTDTAALQADYQINEKVSVYVKQQITLQEEGVDQTTIGIEAKPSDKVSVLMEEVIGDKGLATNIKADVNVTGKVTLTGDYAYVSDETGNVANDGKAAAAVGLKAKVNDDTEVRTSIGTSRLFTENSDMTVSLGASSKINEKSTVDTDISLIESSNDSSAKVSFGGTTEVDDKTQTETRVSVTDSSTGELTREYTLGTTKKLADDLTLVTSRIFGTDDKGESLEAQYSLVKEKNGRKLQGSLSRKYSDEIDAVSSTNIFGLSGDLTDRWALSTNIERGQVKHLDGTTSDRQAYSLGVGFVKKDIETGKTFESSTKIEMVKDEGSVDTVQYLVRNATEGWITQELSLFGKAEVSQTRNLTDDSISAQHKEFVVGGAYRPLYHDKLNLLTRYTYLEGLAPQGQLNDSDVLENRAHVMALDAIYDLNDKWQLTEKLAYRTLEEKVEGFDFNKTHTWLMIQRVNYKLDSDWSIGGEFRILRQQEAQDMKRGFLIEVARQVGEFAQLGIGYNFTDFDDDLTNLDYTTQGPFIRLTGKFYDRTKEEKQRSKEKWLEEKVTRWAWQIVYDELDDPESKVLMELNEYFNLAQEEHNKGHVEVAMKIYRDIITAAQMMFVEAADYIRERIDREKELEKMYKLSDQYFKNGEYEKSKKILEKLLEEVQDAVVE